MTTLKFIREVKNSRLLLLGIAEEGESVRYTVSSAVLEEIGSPSVGDFLDEEQMEIIKAADCRLKAQKKALNILAFADNNKKNLAAKLYHAGFDRETVAETVDEMVSLGYIDERRQLKRIILSEANLKLRGPKKIIPTLIAKGYSSSDISSVMYELVDSGEIDFSRNARLLVEKKLSDVSDSEEKKKLLYKNGF